MPVEVTAPRSVTTHPYAEEGSERMADGTVETREGAEVFLHAQQLEREIREGHPELFPAFESAVDTLTQLSWFQGDRQNEEHVQLYETACHWKAAYFHLHVASECCSSLWKAQEGDDHELWEKLLWHMSELERHKPFFTSDMEVRSLQFQNTIRVWRIINDHLYYGGEAVAAIEQGFSPFNIQKLRGEIVALYGGSLFLGDAYPLQRQRAQVLKDFWVTRIQAVFGHQTGFSPTSTILTPSAEISPTPTDPLSNGSVLAPAAPLDTAANRS